MKKIVNITLVIALVAIGLFILTGCGQNPALSAAAGTYEGQYTKFVGDPDTSKDDTEEFTLELKADGTGVHHRNDADFNLTWTLEGDKFTMKETFLGASIDYTGTLANGKLDIFNGDPSDDLTCEYVFEKK